MVRSQAWRQAGPSLNLGLCWPSALGLVIPTSRPRWSPPSRWWCLILMLHVRLCQHTHFTDEDTEAQGSTVSSPALRGTSAPHSMMQGTGWPPRR